MLIVTCYNSRFYRAHPRERVRGQQGELIGILVYHILVMTGVAIVAVGVSKAANADTKDEASRDMKMAKAGTAILCVGWVALALMLIRSVMPGVGNGGPKTQHNQGTRLLIAVIVAIPFLAVRVFSSLAYFVSGNEDLNAATGKLGFKVGLYAIPEVLVTLLLLGVGRSTRNIAREPSKKEMELTNNEVESTGLIR